MSDDQIAGDDPRERYVAALQMLASQCEGIAARVEDGEYPYYPQGNLNLLEQTHTALLAWLATTEQQRRAAGGEGGIE